MSFLFDLDNWQEIKSALVRNKMRTALTAFGVFWGIFLLMVMLGSGTGLRNGVTRGFAGAATNSLFIWTNRTQKPYAGMPAGRVMSSRSGRCSRTDRGTCPSLDGSGVGS